MGKTIYQKIKNAKSPLKDKHENPNDPQVTVGDWESTDLQLQDAAGNLLINPQQQVTTTYTPPVTTPEGDAAYAALTEEQRKAQDAKYIAANTKTTTAYRGDLEGKDPKFRETETIEEKTTVTPEQKMYNPGYFEAMSAKLAAKQERKREKQLDKANRKAIRRYEEGSKGFLGIGKGKGKGELTSQVVSAYDRTGLDNKDLKRDKDGNIIGDKDQKVGRQMRGAATSLGLNKSGGQIGSIVDKVVTADGKTETVKTTKKTKEEIEKGTAGQTGITGKPVGTMNKYNKNKSPFKMAGPGSRGKSKRIGNYLTKK